ncbi:LysR family transcriptional regulator [Rhizobium sp. L1K21]|nr:LysR family transcriptional regulator [Rhizobium sp. L1K21]
MSLDPRYLSILLQVSRSGSFTAAARELNMSQPAVSITIAQLEDRIGTPVVVRDRKGATLTDAGRLLLRRARAIENILRHAEQEIAGHREETDGPLMVGGTPGALLALLPPVLQRLRQEDRNFAMQALELKDEDIAASLRTRTIEVALCNASPLNLPSDIAQTTLQSEPFVLIAPLDCDLPEKDIEIADTVSYPWILPLAEGVTRRQLEAVFLSAGVPLPRTIMRCDALATMKTLVAEAGFMTILPASVVSREVNAGELRAITLRDGPPPRRLALWRMSDDELSPLAARFVSVARGLRASSGIN